MAVTILTQPTPNPNAMKFTLDRVMSAGTSKTITGKAEAAGDPLAEALFAIPGVKTVFYLNNFVTITKEIEADWGTLTAAVEQVIRTHFGE